MHHHTHLTRKRERFFRISHSRPLVSPLHRLAVTPLCSKCFLHERFAACRSRGRFCDATVPSRHEAITPASIIILFLQAQRLGYVSVFMGSLISKDLHVLQMRPILFLTSTEKLEEEGTGSLCPVPHNTVCGRDPGTLPVWWRSGLVPLGTAYNNDNKPQGEVSQWGAELCCCSRAWRLTPGSYGAAVQGGQVRPRTRK